MKGILVLSALMAGAYIFMLNFTMNMATTQLKDVAKLYENMDQTTSSIENGQYPNIPGNTQDLKSVIDAYINSL